MLNTYRHVGTFVSSARFVFMMLLAQMSTCPSIEAASEQCRTETRPINIDLFALITSVCRSPYLDSTVFVFDERLIAAVRCRVLDRPITMPLTNARSNLSKGTQPIEAKSRRRRRETTWLLSNCQKNITRDVQTVAFPVDGLAGYFTRTDDN
jgi:hypothetical protein